MSELRIAEIDWNDPAQREALPKLLQAFAADPALAGQPIPETVLERVVNDLPQFPGAVVLLAWWDEQPAGMLIAFPGYTTFLGGRLWNIHDVAVAAEYQGRGIGRQLMQRCEELARAAGCVRLTLEVREDNAIAQRLYQSLGFGPGPAPQVFWKKSL